MNLAQKTESAPYDVKGFTDLGIEVAASTKIPIKSRWLKYAGISLATTRIEDHILADKAEVGAEGEQS